MIIPSVEKSIPKNILTPALSGSVKTRGVSDGSVERSFDELDGVVDATGRSSLPDTMVIRSL